MRNKYYYNYSRCKNGDYRKNNRRSKSSYYEL